MEGEDEVGYSPETKTKKLDFLIRSKMALHANKGNRTQITASESSRFDF
jgi:hypothetical protein